MELVVAGIGQVDPEAGPGAVEDLDGGVNPHLGVPQPLPVNMQVIPRVASMKEYSLAHLMPSEAPSSMRPLASRMERTTYGMVAVIHTTFPLDFTPLKREM